MGTLWMENHAGVPPARESTQPGSPQQVLAASSSTRKKGNVNHTKGPNISANNSHPGRSRVQITLQHFMGSSCRELLTDTCLRVHTRKSQFPTGQATFGEDSTPPVLHQSTPCPRSRGATAWEALTPPSPAYCAPSSPRKMHLCVHLLSSTDHELSPN